MMPRSEARYRALADGDLPRTPTLYPNHIWRDRFLARYAGWRICRIDPPRGWGEPVLRQALEHYKPAAEHAQALIEAFMNGKDITDVRRDSRTGDAFTAGEETQVTDYAAPGGSPSASYATGMQRTQPGKVTSGREVVTSLIDGDIGQADTTDHTRTEHSSADQEPERLSALRERIQSIERLWMDEVAEGLLLMTGEVD